ncbi:16S rRNA (cytosine(967)-C(5))-methyltransferase RsmB [Rappaport israeli]|uniref:16S rRNA (cytosine(967)-C(5))-methyltransferase RsmB n=1 Tax=Rappaport israeli TaxID=1839807 RepID=UPI000931777C|nr:16S rRNA (cytosine(967)-C(5))-methyltransferase RsmB [Rappaport israeli]
MNITARQAALTTLLEVIDKKRSLAVLIEPSKKNIRPTDLALYQALVYGTLREMRALSHIRDSMLDKPLNQDPTAGLILNLGLYQLLRMALGDHGVINETVRLAEHNGNARAKGLINAILRRTQRERDYWTEQLNHNTHRNVPDWVARHYKTALPQIGQAYSQAPPLTIRLHPAHQRDQWLTHHPDARKNPLHPQAITLNSGLKVQDIYGFNDGIVSIQDAAAQIAASLLAPKEGERILDACAAPGGKTGHLLELTPNIHLDALDHDPARLKKVRDNLTRLKAQAQLISADASQISQWYQNTPYDAILLDAPCSGSGVIRRHPDISWLRTEDDLKRLPKTQMRLLTSLWRTLKPNGRLLYTTCSLQPRENQLLIEQFLGKHPNARLQPLTLPHAQDTGFGHLRLPDNDGDGFFYALLSKTL